jgi:uncharacterized protein YdcH (DUF465 family)
MLSLPHLKNAYQKIKEESMENRDISQILYEQDPEYRSLTDQHRSLENRLQELSSRLYLSDSEKLEEVTLKKKKLFLKDRMQELIKKNSV